MFTCCPSAPPWPTCNQKVKLVESTHSTHGLIQTEKVRRVGRLRVCASASPEERVTLVERRMATWRPYMHIWGERFLASRLSSRGYGSLFCLPLPVCSQTKLFSLYAITHALYPGLIYGCWTTYSHSYEPWRTQHTFTMILARST